MKKSLFNALTGIMSQFLIALIGVAVPRLYLLYFGSEMNGIVSAVMQIYAYFAIFDAGVGAASLQALFAPVAKQERSAISGIIAATHQFYKRTTFIYAGFVAIFAIIFPLVTDSDISKVTIVFIILIQGIPNVLVYYYYSKYKVLLEAEGREYVIYNLQTFSSVVANALKIVFILCGMSILVVQTSSLIINSLQMLIVKIYVKRNYPWLDLKAKPNHQAIAQRNSALVHQLAWLVFNNTDIVILSIFTGFMVTSIYTVYSMLFGIINGIVISLATSVRYMLGQTYNTDRDKYPAMYDVFETYFYVLVFPCFIVTYLLAIPFVQLYTAGVHDIAYADPLLALLFLLTYLLSTSRIPSDCTRNYAGHFKQTQTRSMIEAGLNISLSVICVQFIGVYGALAGTIVALLYRSNDLIIYANKNILGRSVWPSYRRLLVGWLYTALVLVASQHIALPFAVDSYVSIVLCAALYLVVIGGGLFVIMSLIERESFKGLKQMLMSALPGR